MTKMFKQDLPESFIAVTVKCYYICILIFESYLVVIVKYTQNLV